MNETETLKTSIRELLQLLELLRAAEEYQYTMPTVRTGPDMGEHAPEISDPTGTAVVDETRLLLRSKVKRTESDIQALSKATRIMRDRLEVALQPWTGHTSGGAKRTV